MHHMTANWSPIAQAERDQLCYGVWGVVGTTRGWPQVVNIWEEDGFGGLATSFRHEFNHPTLQDPKLAKWWSEAAGYRRRGDDRVLVPAPWTSTIEQLCAPGVHAEVFAHEQVTVQPGRRAALPGRGGPARSAAVRRARLAAHRRLGNRHGERDRGVPAVGGSDLGAVGIARDGRAQLWPVTRLATFDVWAHARLPSLPAGRRAAVATAHRAAAAGQRRTAIRSGTSRPPAGRSNGIERFMRR